MMRVLSATNLKIIAIILMFGDHVHQMFSGAPVALNVLGRAVFPIFMFVVAESFHHTRSKGKFILRLGIASAAMAVGSILLMRVLPNADLQIWNSAFSCFFVTAIYMLAVDYFRKGNAAEGLLLAIIPILLAIPVLLLEDNRTALLIPSLLTLLDGGWFMVALGVLFYIFRENRVGQVIILLAFSVGSYFAFNNVIQPWMALAIIPIIMYNGAKGRGLKWLFYGFYPIHIWVLYIIATMIK